MTARIVRRGCTAGAGHLASWLAMFLLGVVAPTASAQPIFSEVQYDLPGADTGRQRLELWNPGSSDYELSGHWLYFPPASYRIPAGTIIAPGATLTIHLNRSGDTGDGVLYTGIGGIRNLRSRDAIGLYTVNLFADATRLLDFVQWGEAGFAGEAVAVEAGLWEAGARIDTTSHRTGASLVRISAEAGVDSWCVSGEPSFAEIVATCVVPRAPRSLRLSELRGAESGLPSAVELLWTGNYGERLDGATLVVGDRVAWTAPPGIEARSGDRFVVVLGAEAQAPDDGAARWFHAGVDSPDVDLSRPGAVALYAANAPGDSTWIVDFAQWGEAGQSGELVAVEAGLWGAGEAIDTADRQLGGTLISEARDSGVSIWSIDHTPTVGEDNASPPSREVVVNEVLVAPSGAGLQAIEIINLADVPLDLAGHSLCFERASAPIDCFELPAGVVVASQEFAIVWLGGEPNQVDNNIFTGGGVAPLDRDRGAVAILRGGDPMRPGDFLDYIRWGGSGEDLLAVAAVAGLWPDHATIEVDSIASGTSIAYLGSGRGPQRYRLDSSPTIGRSNEGGDRSEFSRGDCSGDGTLDLSDAIFLLTFQFLGGETPSCEDACDFNDDATLDITDAVGILAFQFLGDTPPAPPQSCGIDPTNDPLEDPLGCELFRPCDA